MATVALDGLMLVTQKKLGVTAMLKLCLGPTALSVTSLTSIAQIAIVSTLLVVRGMAACAFCA